ncbi:putative periplasmic zinc-binding protein TroA [Peptostreptococcaceae bacterium AS15]|nr:ABC transporter, substrate-binding protein [[Eubacterium] yurii subsp. margaretiae ATCC 43715]EJP19177.1 putative periplasmic zinc-binding protein TroA [Peptostreptococcaceae bacterium AS15]
MKKLLRYFVLGICLVFCLSACSNKADTSKNDNGGGNTDGKKNVVVTTSFLYDMVQQIAGDTVNVDLIIPAGEDPHLYIAKPEDLKKLQTADLVLYHGLHFEGKMVEVLEKLGTPVSKEFPQDKIGKMEEDGETVIDPHFWFDISLYKMAVAEAQKALSNLNSKDSEMYEKNTEKYLAELTELDSYVKENIQKIPEGQRYLITPHDAFNYFSKSYGIIVKAPQGVSTSSEVANADIQETIDFIVKHKIKAVFAESTTDPARMEKLREGVVAKGSDVKIVKGEGNELFSDSLAPKGQKGDNYIDMYKHNVDLIVSNLSN